MSDNKFSSHVLWLISELKEIIGRSSDEINSSMSLRYENDHLYSPKFDPKIIIDLLKDMFINMLKYSNTFGFNVSYVDVGNSGMNADGLFLQIKRNAKKL